MPEFEGSTLKNDIVIGKLYTVHYFEFSSNYRFSGEKHDFWELVYVDKGEITVFADDSSYVLKQGEAFFHKPNQWHNIQANGVIAPNVAIVSFECRSASMEFFNDRLVKVGQNEKKIISKIIMEYTNAFSTPLNDLYTNKLEKSTEAPIGSEQLLKLYLSELLILFLRSTSSEGQYPMISINNSQSTINVLLAFMQNNINAGVSVDQLVKHSGLNRTGINSLFKRNFNMGAIEYFINMKIDTAKKYLRENNFNVTQISEILGYSNVHYFSRQFKKVTGMSPIEYSTSIMALNEIR